MHRETASAVTPLNWDEYDLDLDIDSSPETAQLTNGQRLKKPEPLEDNWKRDLRERVAPQKERLIRLEAYLQELQSALDELLPRLENSEQILRAPTPLGADAESMGVKYSEKVLQCQDYVDTVQTLERRLREETGVAKVMSMDPQVKDVLTRWQGIETEAFEKDQRLLRRQQQWTQLKADLRRLLAWLEEAEAVQARQTSIPSEIRQLEAAVRRQKEFTRRSTTANRLCCQ